MENKILILLMTCGQPLYEREEKVCRDTFLKDAKKAGVSYYFYKGTDENHPERMIDEETNTIYLPVDDSLKGTSMKTAMALSEALKIDDWDYLIKTNVSTWLDIKKILKTVEKLEGREDKNIYGARFLANDASKKVPFPRGHFMMISRSLVEGASPIALKLANSARMPRTDDTLLCLSLLYYTQKVMKLDYVGQLKEVPSVTTWSEWVQDAQEWPDALSVRCKGEPSIESTPDNMMKVHAMKHSTKQERKGYRPMGMIETKHGFMSYDSYVKLEKTLGEQAKKKEEPAPVEKPKETPQPPQQSDEPNKILEIREKLEGLMKGL